MSVDAAQAKLQRGMKELLALWHETQEVWRDPKADEFAKVYLNDLERDLRSTMSAMDQLRIIIGQVRNDCQ